MKTKNNAQKIVSAKILAKLVELANKYVVPCIKINAPGKYTAKELWEGKDSFGNNLWWSIDEEHNGDELSVAVTAEDFTAEEMAILGYEPKFRLQIKLEKIFYAISKYEQLAGVRGNNVAKFVVGEPETLYETERAKVVLFDYAKQKIVTKTKTLTIISDSLAIYLLKKANYAFCLKINGKWIDVYHRVEYFDIAETIERAKKIITYESTKSGAEAYIAKNNDKYADFVRMILSELEAMEQSTVAETSDNAEPSAETICTASSTAEENGTNNAEAVENGNADKATQSGGNSDSPQAASKDGGRTETPPKNEVPPKSPANKTIGRKSAVLSDFRGKGDKRYHPSGENRKSGVYCGKSGVLQVTPRGSPAKTNIYYLTRV